MKRRVKHGQYFLHAHLLKSHKDRPMTVHVDSGVTNFIISEKCLLERLPLMGYTRPPTHVRLSMGDSKNFVVTKALEVDSHTTFDFVIGKKMLSKNRCALDYSKFRLFFEIHGKLFMTDMNPKVTDSA